MMKLYEFIDVGGYPNFHSNLSSEDIFVTSLFKTGVYRAYCRGVENVPIPV